MSRGRRLGRPNTGTDGADANESGAETYVDEGENDVEGEKSSPSEMSSIALQNHRLHRRRQILSYAF